MVRKKRWNQKETITEFVLARFIREVKPFDGERMELVEDILAGLECGFREALKSQIYQYGSTIRAEELFARQLFLWFLEIIEEQKEQRQFKK